MIRDWQWGFEFWRLHSLLSWAFSWQDKMIKIIGIIMDLWHLKNMKVNTLNTELCWLCSFFLYWCPQLNQLILKNLIVEFSKKHDQTSTNLITSYDVIALFFNYLVFKKINRFCAFTNEFNELLLTLSSPFDNKSKKLHLM